MTKTHVEQLLGGSGISVGALGAGCWAIGGAWIGSDGKPAGWGGVDEADAVQAIRRGLELGITFFDTADVYGTGQSERVLGRALAGNRDKAIIATKFGWTFDETTRRAGDADISGGYVRRACEASLRRLATDRIDLFQLHVGSLPPDQAQTVADALDELVQVGLIRAYGWSTDDVTCAALWADHEGYVAVQHAFNVFEDAPDLLALCAGNGLTSIARSPLAAGFLTGKYGAGTPVAADDWRAQHPDWIPYFDAQGNADDLWLARLEAIREILTSEGRTLAQGALAWIWASSPITLAIPGFKSVAQLEENARALTKGPLTKEQVSEIRTLLAP